MSDKCPIGLDNSRDICSAGCCSNCIQDLRAELTRLRKENERLAKERDGLKSALEFATKSDAELVKRGLNALYLEVHTDVARDCSALVLGHISRLEAQLAEAKARESELTKRLFKALPSAD